MTTYLIAYVPVLHEGYRAWFARYADAVLYLVPPELVGTAVPRLPRDLRCLPPSVMRDAIRGTGIVAGVEVLTEDNITALNAQQATIVMPRDDVSDALSPRLSLCSLTFEQVFLRWDKPITLAEQEIQPDQIVSDDAFDRDMIRRAHEEAARSADWWRQVGAVAVRDGEVLASAYNAHHPSELAVFADGNPRDNFDAGEHLEVSDTLHGEAGIVAWAARRILVGSTVYVTTFPCINCARLLAKAGVVRLVYRDGYSRLDAVAVLKDHGVEIVRVTPE